MKILHLIFSFNIGGAETMLADIVNQQCQYETVGLIIINESINEGLLNTISDDVKVVCIGRTPGSKSLIPLIRLNKEIYDFQPDIIHCHNHNLITLLLPFFRKIAFLTVHSVGISTQNFLKYKRCIAISNAVKEDIYYRAKLKIKAINNGINCALVKIKEEESLDMERPILKIVQVSRLLHEQKGQHIALRAIKRLAEDGVSDIQLDFIGAGASQPYLEHLAKELGITGMINFLGMRDRQYVYQHLSDYHLLIQPSLSEGFGLTVAEAMAAKLPVLVSNIEGPMEVIKNGAYGDYFEKGNAEDLALKIRLFIAKTKKEKMECAERVERAFQYCNEQFHIKKTALSYVEEYKRSE